MRSFFNRLFIFIISILFLFGIFIFFLPSFISTDWGKKQLEAWINHKIPGTVEIRSMDLHWGKGQKIEGFLLRDPDGQSVMGFEKAYTDASLWQLINKSTQLGFTRVKDFNAAIVTDQNGQSNLQRALGLGPKVNTSLPSSTISLSDVQGDFYISSDAKVPFSAHLKGTTREGTLIGSFELDLILNGLDGTDWGEWTQDAQKYLSVEGSKDAKIQAKVVNFPVDLLDQFMALKGVKQCYFRPLLGEKLDIYLDKEPNPEGLAFNLTLLSPQFQGDVKAKIVKDLILLQEPAKFHIDLLPASINNLSQNGIEILEPSRVEMTVQDLQIPFNFFHDSEPVDFCKYSFNLQANLSPTQLNIASFNKIKINDLKIFLRTPQCEKQIELKIEGKAEEYDEPFDIHFESTLNKPAHSADLLNQLKKDMNASLSIYHFPLNLIPAFNQNQALLAQIGPRADIQLKLMHQHEDQFHGRLSLHTAALELDNAEFNIDKELNLAAPAIINWKIPSSAFANAFDSEKYMLNQSLIAQAKINQLSMPLNHFEKGKVQAEITLPNLNFPRMTPFGQVQIKDAKMNIDGKNLSVWQISLMLATDLVIEDQSTSPLLYQPVNWTANTILKINPNGKIEAPSIQVKAESLAVNAELDGQLTPDSIFLQNKPFTFNYRMTPKAFEELGKTLEIKHLPNLLGPSFIELNLEPISIDLKNDWLSKLILKGTAHIDRMTLKDHSDLALSMEKITMPMILDARRNQFEIRLDGTAFTSIDPKPNPFSMNLKIEQWLYDSKVNFDHAKTEFSSNFISVPTSILGSFLTNQDLTPLVGPSVDLKLSTLFDREQHNAGYWDMNIDSTFLHARARLFLDERITLYESTKPTVIVRWTLSPEGYEYLQKNILKSSSVLSITEPFTMTAHLSTLNFPLKLDVESIEEGQIKGHISTSEIKWKEFPGLAPIKFEGTFESPKLSKSLSFDFLTQSKEAFSISLNGLVTDLLDSSGGVQKFENIHLNMDLKADQVPAEFFQALDILTLEQIEKFKALWGDKIDAQAKMQMHKLTGPLSGAIKGNNGSASLNGKLTNGTLFLNAPFEWSIKVTPLLGKDVLKKNVPFLSSIIGADNPVVLTIDPQGFSCPLWPFDINKAAVGKGKIDAGKVHFLNEGDLNMILSNITPIKDKQMTIWFTPIFFNLSESNLKLQRFDLLIANLYTLACWGDINLKRHDLDLVLGLTSTSLNQAFGVKGLDEDYILQVPIKGRNGKLEVDKAKIIGRVSALVAQMKGGNKGKVLGSILEIALSDDIADPRPPAPTTHPFPWAKEFQSKQNETSQDKNPKDKKEKRPKNSVDSLLNFINQI